MLYEVSQNELIKKVAVELKKEIHMPSWAPFVKTGVHKERPPVDDDWWYIRAASVLRKIYLLGPIGTSKLRTKYGGKKNRGVKPEKFYKGSGTVIRKILQQLEEAKLVKQETKNKHKGRVITPKGVSILFSAAKMIKGSQPVKKTPSKEKIQAKKIEGKTQPEVAPPKKEEMTEEKPKTELADIKKEGKEKDKPVEKLKTELVAPKKEETVKEKPKVEKKEEKPKIEEKKTEKKEEKTLKNNQ